MIFHNLSGYDSYLFIKQLGKIAGNINCIAKNEENYISLLSRWLTRLLEIEDS